MVLSLTLYDRINFENKSTDSYIVSTEELYTCPKKASGH